MNSNVTQLNAAPSVFSMVWASIARAFKAVVVANQHRQAKLALSNLPDYLLNDIGVNRAGIDRFVEQGRPSVVNLPKRAKAEKTVEAALDLAA